MFIPPKASSFEVARYVNIHGWCFRFNFVFQLGFCFFVGDYQGKKPHVDMFMAAVALFCASGGLFCLAKKGLFRDDGMYEDWCSTLSPWGAVAGMWTLRAWHRCSKVVDEDEEEDYEEDEDFVPASALDEHGNISVEWLCNVISNYEAKQREMVDLHYKQAEQIQRLVYQMQQQHALWQQKSGMW